MLRLRPLISAALLLPLALVLAASTKAEGLIQLGLGGEVVGAPPAAGENGHRTGHLVEVEIGAITGGPGVMNGVEVDLVLHIHLTEGTTGADLAQLVAKRLHRLRVDALVTTPQGNHASLWVESARYVRIRLGGGLTSDVACAEGPPVSLRVAPPSAIAEKAALIVTASTALVLRDRAPVRGRASAELDLEPTASAASISSRLLEATSEGLISDRPRGDTWRPTKMASGAAITGVSVQLDSPKGGDWRLEIEL